MTLRTAKPFTMALVMGDLNMPDHMVWVCSYDSKGVIVLSGAFIPWRRVKKVRVYG